MLVICWGEYDLENFILLDAYMVGCVCFDLCYKLAISRVNICLVHLFFNIL